MREKKDMHLSTLGRLVPALAGAAALALASEPAWAAATPNKGDTGFMFTSTILVLLMTIPGLALFYGALVRTKNMLSARMQVFAFTWLGMVIWVTYRYSMPFTNRGAWTNYSRGCS